MRANRYGILEPKLNCSQICPLPELDYVLMPLVAFDKLVIALEWEVGFTIEHWHVYTNNTGNNRNLLASHMRANKSMSYRLNRGMYH